MSCGCHVQCISSVVPLDTEREGVRAYWFKIRLQPSFKPICSYTSCLNLKLIKYLATSSNKNIMRLMTFDSKRMAHYPPELTLHNCVAILVILYLKNRHAFLFKFINMTKIQTCLTSIFPVFQNGCFSDC